MGWRTIVVNVHSKLSYQNNHLVFKTADQTELIHLSEIDIILLETTDITLTTMLIKRLVDEKILLIFCDDKRMPIANLVPFYGRHDASLQLSHQIFWTMNIKVQVWTQIIGQKIQNQAFFLASVFFTEKAQSLLRLSEQLEPFDPSNREGHAARLYFNTLFGNDFNRGADNDINAGLDYGYSLLISMFAREIVLNGCVTQIGLKHSNQFNHFNLASDIMEPFRPLVDSIIYHHRTDDFNEMKKSLFHLFLDTYQYNGKDMFLTNIISDYTKRVIKSLNSNNINELPEFKL